MKKQGELLQLPDGMLLHQGEKPWDNPGRHLSGILYLEKTRIIVATSDWDVTPSEEKTPWDNPGRYLSCILYLENNRIIIATSGWEVYTIGE